MAHKKRATGSEKSISYLESHAEPYVTVADLADYWSVSRKQIYKQIEAGTLPAIRLGPRLLRIRTADAREFEKRAQMDPPGGAERKARLEELSLRPEKMGNTLQRRSRTATRR